MKRYILFGLLVAVLCLPLAFVAFLLAASSVPAVDKLTLSMPQGVRNTIAKIAMQKVGYGKEAEPSIQRVLRLDPENALAWSRVCSMAVGDDPVRTDAVASCNRAVALNDSQNDFYHLGQAQMAADDPCPAEDTFGQANSKVSGGDVDYLRSMGQAAYLCGGRLPASIAELEAARDLDAKFSIDKDEDAEETDEYKQDLQLDQEWLAVAYTKFDKPQLALAACTQAHPDLQACTCSLKDRKPVCSGTTSKAAR